MIKELIKLANHLDSKGHSKEADYLDGIIKRSNLENIKKVSSDIKKILGRFKILHDRPESVVNAPMPDHRKLEKLVMGFYNNGNTREMEDLRRYLVRRKELKESENIYTKYNIPTPDDIKKQIYVQFAKMAKKRGTITQDRTVEDIKPTVDYVLRNSSGWPNVTRHLEVMISPGQQSR